MPGQAMPETDRASGPTRGWDVGGSSGPWMVEEGLAEGLAGVVWGTTSCREGRYDACACRRMRARGRMRIPGVVFTQNPDAKRVLVSSRKSLAVSGPPL